MSQEVYAMPYADLTVRGFADILASKSATPGGGGASALAGALGAALGTMVGNLTVGKKKYAAVEDDLKTLMAEAETVRQELLDCIDADAEAFAPLSKAYAIPKDDPGRPEIMEACLRTAAAVPMRILKLCCRAIDLHRAFADKGSVLAVSDAGTGVVLCWGAMYGAAMNVLVNTKSMTDRAWAEQLNAEVFSLMDKYWKIADAVYEDVLGRFK